jgi:hypothetical protein
MFGFKTRNGLAIFLVAAFAGIALLWLGPRGARRAEPRPVRVIDIAAEKAKNAQCVKDVCSIVLSKEANGPDVTCDLAHRWDGKVIDALAESKEASWSLGPARCSLRIGAKRAAILAAVTSPENKLQLSGKSVSCEVGDEQYEVSADVTADFTFKNGVVTAISLGGSDYDGPMFVARALFSAWRIEQRVGAFQADMLREANRFIKNECPKALAGSTASLNPTASVK